MKIDSLDKIVDKKECISTFTSNDLITVPEKVDASYKEHIFTHTSLGETEDYEKKLIQKFEQQKTPIGYLVAPYGYGKTTTAIHAWESCENKNIIAIPPFICKSFTNVMDATYGWIKYRLQQEAPDFVVDIEGIYEKYGNISLEKLAKKDSDKFGISIEYARKSIEDKINDGLLTINTTPELLVKFLDECVTIIEKAGFKGLIIFADEFQDYFGQQGKSENEMLTDWRNLVWSITNKRYGIIFSIPEKRESILNERAGDIIHRLKNEGLSINLKNVYDIEFPKYLIRKYAEKFEFNYAELVDDDVLTSIGQITTRDDLGNGPRSVINIFKLIFSYYENTGKKYTAIDLIDNYLDGKIVYDGPNEKIVSVVKDSLSSDRVKSDGDKQVIKLLAAFPKGCPLDILEKYGVKNNFDELSKSLLGDVIKRLAEGPTLTELSKTADGETSTTDELIKKFRDYYSKEDICAYESKSAFIKYILPNIFPDKKGGLIGFAGLTQNKIFPTSYGDEECIIKGTFNATYPNRKLHITITHKEDKQRTVVNLDEDFGFGFYLNWKNPGVHKIVENDANKILFILDINKRISSNAALPSDLNKLQEFISPEEVTPLLALSLIRYTDKFLEKHDVQEHDKDDIEYLKNRLVKHTILSMFDSELKDSCGYALKFTGKKLVEDVFNNVSKAFYPDYKTFIHSNHWDAAINNNYMKALDSVKISQRRGHEKVCDKKSNIASMFGYDKTYAGLENLLSVWQGTLIESSWKNDGTDACIKFLVHPLESKIFDYIEKNEQISEDIALDLGKSMGYIDEEVNIALQLLYLRQMIDFDEAHKTYTKFSAVLSSEELLESLEKLKMQCICLKEIDSNFNDGMQEQLGNINEEINFSNEEYEALSAIQWNIKKFNDEISYKQKLVKDRLIIQLDQLEKNIDIMSHQGLPRELNENPHGMVGFVQHLLERKNSLSKKYLEIISGLKKIKIELAKTKSIDKDDSIDSIKHLDIKCKGFVKQIKEFEKEQEQFNKLVSGYKVWLKILGQTDTVYSNISEYNTKVENVPDFDDIENFINNVRLDFAQQRDDLLLNNEIYMDKINDIRTKFDQKGKEQTTLFNTKKEEYNELLRKIGFNARLNAILGITEIEDSYRGLYEQIASALKGRLEEFHSSLEKMKNDVLHAQRIRGLDVEDLLNDIELILKETEGHLSTIDIEIIKDGTQFNEIVDQIVQLNENIENKNIEINEINRPTDVEDEASKQILNYMHEKRNVSLEEILTDLDYSIEDVEKHITNLFKHNQIRIQISTRFRE